MTLLNEKSESSPLLVKEKTKKNVEPIENKRLEDLHSDFYRLIENDKDLSKLFVNKKTAKDNVLISNFREELLEELL